jgi:membrane protein implicated in regulation of membrane protease activity
MRINLRIILTVLMSLIDDIVIIVLAIYLMRIFGIRVPWWVIFLLVLVLLSWSSLGYWGLVKNPNLGFENMVGKTGLAVGPIRKDGTVRIGHELWYAVAREKIEQGSEIIVVGQSGLKLIVIRKPALSETEVKS